MDVSGWVSLGAVVLTWLGSAAVMYSQRVAFEARMDAQIQGLRAEIERLAGAGAQIAVLQHGVTGLERRLEQTDRLLTRLMGNVVAIATSRGMQVRQDTPGPAADGEDGEG